MYKPLQLGIVKVSFSHEYEPRHFFDKKDQLTRVGKFPKATTVVIESPSEQKTARVSCSRKDHFTFETGRKLAMKKAFSTMTSLTKEERRRVWSEYNKLKTGGRW